MRIGAIVQARFDSARLPGKVLRPLAGRPMLDYLIESVQRVPEFECLIIATSNRPNDDAVARFASERGLECFRGSAHDVAQRMLKAALEAQLDLFARVNGDSPLLDHRLLELGLALVSPEVDLVTNTSPRTYPPGETVEIVRTAALALAHAQMEDRLDKEHVTRFFYHHPDQFTIRRFSADHPFEGIRFAVDTEEDFQRVSDLMARMTQPHWMYDVQELARLAQR